MWKNPNNQFGMKGSLLMKEIKLDPIKMVPPTVITEDGSQFNFFSGTGQPLD